MKHARSSGQVVICIILVASLWFRSQIFAAAGPPLPVARQIARPAPQPVGGYGGARMRYPPGHYPQLRLRSGEAHEVHSVLNVTHVLTFGDYVWDAAGVGPGQVWVRIDLGRQMLSVFRGGDEIGTAVIIYGANDHPTPVGTFHILQKNQYYYSRAYDAPMPFALRITADGVALHASHVRDRVATHGCIGLPLEFARLLYAATSRGDQVEILPDSSGA